VLTFVVRIIKTEILNNPFPDIVPRVRIVVLSISSVHMCFAAQVKEVKVVKKKKVKRMKKNTNLLSFGAAEETELPVKKKKKAKSAHDMITDDPTLVLFGVRQQLSLALLDPGGVGCRQSQARTGAAGGDEEAESSGREGGGGFRGVGRSCAQQAHEEAQAGRRRRGGRQRGASKA
jgi:hypothetical protein